MASHEKKKKNNERNNKRSVNLNKMNSDINQKLSGNLVLKFRLFKNNHRLMDCPSFSDRSMSERTNFVSNVFPKLILLKIISRASYAKKRTVTKNIKRFSMNHLI